MLRSSTLPLLLCSTVIALSAACSSGAAPANRAATQAAAPGNTQAVNAGPGGSSAAKLTNGNVDPCAVLTKADVEAVIGEPSGEPNRAGPSAPLGQVICTYGSAAQTAVKGVQLSVVRTQGMTDQMRKQGYSARKLYDDSKTVFPNRQPVSGVGDDAYQTGRQIQAVQGDTQFTVTFTAGTGATGMDDATLLGLAKTLSSRLPR